MYASKVWLLLMDNSRWTYAELKKRSGLNDCHLGAAIGWLAHENKIELDQIGHEPGEENIRVSTHVNVYIG